VITVVQSRDLRSVQVRDALIEHFRSSALKPGDRVLSEPEIADQFHVGRSTAREALKLLEHDGLVEVRPGLGRYLSSLYTATVERPITRFESVSQMLEGLGYSSRTLILSVEEGMPSEVEAEALRISRDAEVVRVVRLRSEGDEPLIFSIDTLVREHIRGPIRHVDWSGSITALMRDHGRQMSFSTARLQAARLPAAAEPYSLQEYDLWLLITETAFSAGGEPALYAQDYHRGDLFSFNVLRR
jgi:GntR family transcriptional regulator